MRSGTRGPPDCERLGGADLGSRLVFPSQRHTYKPISENAVGYLYNRLVAHGRHVPHGWPSTFSTIMNERAQAQARCPA